MITGTGEPDVARAPLGAARPRRHHRPFSPTRSQIEYRIVAQALRTLRSMPLERACERMAAVVSAGAWISPRLRRIGLENLRHAFPDRALEWHEQVLRECFRNLGRLAAEVAHMSRFTRQYVDTHVGFLTPADEQRWRERMAQERGSLIVGGHFGNWELFAQVQGLLGHPVHLVHRPLRNPLLDDLLARIRSRAGTGVVYKHAAARTVLKALKSGALLAIAIDQHAPGASGIPVPFFGRLASTTPGPARLAQLSGVGMQLVALVRRGATTKHDIHIGPVIDVPRTGDRDADVLAAMTTVNREFEELVRRYPEQWLWLHRRWRLG